MPTFQFTITGVFDGEDQQEAWDQWIDLLSQPSWVEDGTEVEDVTDQDPDEDNNMRPDVAAQANQVLVEVLPPNAGVSSIRITRGDKVTRFAVIPNMTTSVEDIAAAIRGDQ